MNMMDTCGAAGYLALAQNTLEKMRVTGEGPKFVKLGRAVRYRVSDLEAYVADRTVQSTSERIDA